MSDDLLMVMKTDDKVGHVCQCQCLCLGFSRSVSYEEELVDASVLLHWVPNI